MSGYITTGDRARSVAFAIAMVSAPALSAAAAPWPCDEARPAAMAALIAFYPPVALAAKKSGEAVLKCSRSEQDAMTDCQLVSETPVGQGFGAAALAMATKSRAMPAADVPLGERRPRAVTFRFRANAPCITPDVIDKPWMPLTPTWEHFPDFTEFDRASSASRERARGGGDVVLACSVQVDGHVEDCDVIDERPKGAGYDRVALALSRYMVLRTTTHDGVSIVGVTLTFDIPFPALGTIGRQ